MTGACRSRLARTLRRSGYGACLPAASRTERCSGRAAAPCLGPVRRDWRERTSPAREGCARKRNSGRTRRPVLRGVVVLFGSSRRVDRRRSRYRRQVARLLPLPDELIAVAGAALVPCGLTDAVRVSESTAKSPRSPDRLRVLGDYVRRCYDFSKPNSSPRWPYRRYSAARRRAPDRSAARGAQPGRRSAPITSRGVGWLASAPPIPDAPELRRDDRFAAAAGVRCRSRRARSQASSSAVRRVRSSPARATARSLAGCAASPRRRSRTTPCRGSAP